MTFRNAIRFVCAAAAASALAATVVGATTPSRTTYFTFDIPVQLPGVSLPPGAYAFEIANPDTGSNVVRVLNRKRSKVYVSALTRVVTRPAAGRLDAMIVFGETRPSAPRRIHAWYPAGETSGREFLH